MRSIIYINSEVNTPERLRDAMGHTVASLCASAKISGVKPEDIINTVVFVQYKILHNMLKEPSVFEFKEYIDKQFKRFMDVIKEEEGGTRH